MEKDDQDGHQAALDRIDRMDGVEKDDGHQAALGYGHQAALVVEKDDQDGHQAALDRMEWRKMTKMVTRRCLIGWCGER